MKKIFTLLTLALISIGVSAQITAKVWDFTVPTDADLAALRANTGTFTDDTSAKYIKNKNDVAQGSITLALEGSDGTDISVADGLLFGRATGGKLSGGSLRYYYKDDDYYIYFNNSNCTVKLPSVAAGKEVVITSKNYAGDLTLTNGQDATSKTGEQKFIVTADGEVTITFKSKMADLQKIEVRTKVVDVTPPVLESTIPANDATGVMPSGNIVLAFDETVQKVGDNITATLNGTSITGTASGSTVTFAYEDLTINAVNTFSLPANQIQDIAGNKYASAVNISFTTIGSSVVWPFKSSALDQEALVYVDPASDIASYVIEKGSNIADLTVDATKGTLVNVTKKRETEEEAKDDSYIFFSVTPAAGKAFNPTKVEFEVATVGTGNGKYYAYWVNADGTETHIADGASLTRDVPTLKSHDVEGIVLGNGKCGLKLYINGPEGKGIGLWNVKLIGTVVETVTVTIGTDEWATFSDATHALDFSSVSGLTAYMVTGHTGSAITKTEVTGTVPANTGLLLNGAEGTYTVPMIASSSTDVSANWLKAGDGNDASWNSSTETAYVLSGEDGSAQFKKLTSAVAVPVGKAYLVVPEVVTARNLDIDGDVTAIKNIKVGTEDNVYYDLNGRRVLYPTKGLYIVNGKKVLVP